jgi:hypothetical protein
MAKYVYPGPSYIFGIEQSFRIKITNKRINEYVSLVNVSYEIFSWVDSNVTLKFYLNNNLIDTKEYFIQAGQTIYDYPTYVIEKEGNYTIKIVANFTTYNIIKEDSFTFTLTLYDFDVTYYNYTIYNNVKYVDTLAYNIKARCGVLGKNALIVINLTDTEKIYNLVCDNQTIIINESFRFLKEGDKNVSFTLLAVDPSDNKEIKDMFRADLEPPSIILETDLGKGFRDSLTVYANLSFVDSMSPLLKCFYQINNVSEAKDILNNTRLNIDFNVLGKTIIKATCYDLVNHSYSFEKEYVFNIIEFYKAINENTEEEISLYQVIIYNYINNVTIIETVNITKDKIYYLAEYSTGLIVIRVKADGFYERSYAITIKEPSIISLMPVLIPETTPTALLTTIQVLDELNNPVKDAYVVILLPIKGQIIAVTSGYTDSSR